MLRAVGGVSLLAIRGSEFGPLGSGQPLKVVGRQRDLCLPLQLCASPSSTGRKYLWLLLPPPLYQAAWSPGLCSNCPLPRMVFPADALETDLLTFTLLPG